MKRSRPKPHTSGNAFGARYDQWIEICYNREVLGPVDLKLSKPFQITMILMTPYLKLCPYTD